jgi:hypothetical protein
MMSIVCRVNALNKGVLIFLNMNEQRFCDK